MTIQQLTVFVENRQGSLSAITDLLAKEKIDLRALSIADTKEYGILRLIVNDAKKALAALEKNGFLVRITEVLGVILPDEPGALSGALKALDSAGVNVEYLYAFLTRTERDAYMVLRVADNAAAETILTNAGYRTISAGDVATL